jgi:hypothetical protein
MTSICSTNVIFVSKRHSRKLTALHVCGLLGSKLHGSVNSHTTEVNCLNINQKKLNFIRKSCKIDNKATEKLNFPAFIFHYPAEIIFLSKLCYTTDVVGGFSVQIFGKLPWKCKPQNFDSSRLRRSFFNIFFVWNFICQVCGLMDKLKKVKNPNFFNCVSEGLLTSNSKIPGSNSVKGYQNSYWEGRGSKDHIMYEIFTV